jgi:hypothetical protein
LRACVCPDNAVVEGFAGLVVPDDGCFALVGYSDAFYGGAVVACRFEFLHCGFDADFY